MTNHAVSNRADLRERTKTMSRHGDRRGQIADFRDSFEAINWLYLLFKCGIKTKTHFEWLLWHWSSLGQLNLEPTRPNGLVGCKVSTDLVKISVKKATHMGFHYNVTQYGDFHEGPNAAVMMSTSHSMAHGTLCAIIIHKNNFETNACTLNTSMSGKYGHRFVDSISKCISPMIFFYLVSDFAEISIHVYSIEPFSNYCTRISIRLFRQWNCELSLKQIFHLCNKEWTIRK